MLLCSTGALIGRPNGRDFKLLKDIVPQLDCDGLEFMMYESWYDRCEEITAFLQSLDVPIPVFHCEKRVGDLISRNGEGDCEVAMRRFAVNCRMARAIGAEKMVLHLWGGLDSDKDIENNIRHYARLRELSDSYGLLLTVENVVCNGADPMTHLKSLAAHYPDISFTFDTKMAAFHSQLDELYADTNRDVQNRIKHLHINDYGGGHKEWSNLKTLYVGDGKVDFATFFAFLKTIDYQGDFTVEATSFDSEGKINFAKLNETFSKIREYLAN